MPPAASPNYGVDAPGVVTFFGIAGVICLFLGIFVGSGKDITYSIGPWLASVPFLATSGYMIYASKRGKPRLWDRTLDGLGLEGSEQVLDIGCGRGLVMIETAKRLSTGHVTGVDIWRNKDQSGNARANTELNAKLEGVADRVEVRDADMTELPFADDTFDLVTASLSIHNLAVAGDRAKAVMEMMRVVRPGGRIVIIDIAKTTDYAATLAEGPFLDVERSAMSFSIYPPVRTVTARKSEPA